MQLSTSTPRTAPASPWLPATSMVSITAIQKMKEEDIFFTLPNQLLTSMRQHNDIDPLCVSGFRSVSCPLPG